jgi:hypothetical protein
MEEVNWRRGGGREEVGSIRWQKRYFSISDVPTPPTAMHQGKT